MGSIGVLLTFCLGSVIDWKYLALVSFTFSILMSLVCIEGLCNCNRVILRQRYLFCRRTAFRILTLHLAFSFLKKVRAAILNETQYLGNLNLFKSNLPKLGERILLHLVHHRDDLRSWKSTMAYFARERILCVRKPRMVARSKRSGHRPRDWEDQERHRGKVKDSFTHSITLCDFAFCYLVSP